MSIRDDFLKDVDQAQKLVRQLNLDFSDRAKLAEALESTARIDARIRGSLQQLAVEVDSILRGIKRYETQPERYKLSKKEFERRKKVSEELEGQLNEFDKTFSSSYEAPGAKPGIDFRGAVSSETQETRNLSSKQLRDSKRDLIRQHDTMEQALAGTSENLVVAVHKIGDEVDLHNELLDKVQGNAEKKADDLQKASYRVKKLLYESSDCCLCLTIVVLIASLLIFLFIL